MDHTPLEDPQMDDIRGWYIDGRRVHNPFASDATLAEPFWRWLAEHDTEVRHAALRETLDGALTNGEWREFQRIPEQGYSHRHWVDTKIAERSRAQFEAGLRAAREAVDDLPGLNAMGGYYARGEHYSGYAEAHRHALAAIDAELAKRGGDVA